MRTRFESRLLGRSLICILAFNHCWASGRADPIGIMESGGGAASAVQDPFGSTQVVVGAPITQSPFQANPRADLGPSFVDTHLTATINGHVIVLAIETQHHCVVTQTSRPDCRTVGTLYLNPTTDVYASLTGSWNYQMLGDPTWAGFHASVNRMNGNQQGPLLFTGGDSVDSFLDPSTGTIPLNTGGLLAAGGRYRVDVQIISSAGAAGPQIGATVNGHGSIQLNVTPLPEPAAAAQMLLAAMGILIGRRRTGHRRRAARQRIPC